LWPKTGKSAEGPEQAAEHGTEHKQPKPCGSASTKLCSADPEDLTGQQAGCPDRYPLVHELKHQHQHWSYKSSHGEQLHNMEQRL